MNEWFIYNWMCIWWMVMGSFITSLYGHALRCSHLGPRPRLYRANLGIVFTFGRDIRMANFWAILLRTHIRFKLIRLVALNGKHICIKLYASCLYIRFQLLTMIYMKWYISNSSNFLSMLQSRHHYVSKFLSCFKEQVGPYPYAILVIHTLFTRYT